MRIHPLFGLKSEYLEPTNLVVNDSFSSFAAWVRMMRYPCCIRCTLRGLEKLFGPKILSAQAKRRQPASVASRVSAFACVDKGYKTSADNRSKARTDDFGLFTQKRNFARQSRTAECSTCASSAMSYRLRRIVRCLQNGRLTRPRTITPCVYIRLA